MPNINSTDSGYQNFNRRLSDLEEEIQSEAKRRRQKDEASVEKIEDNFRAGAKKEAARSEKAIHAAKEQMQSELSANRRQVQRELDAMKRATYDRMGRYNGEEASVLKEQLRQTQSAREVESDRFERQLDKIEDTYSKRMEDRATEQQDRLEETIEKVKKNVVEPYREQIERTKSVMSDQQKRSQEKYNRMDAERTLQNDEERARNRDAILSLDKAFKHQLDKNEENQDAAMIRAAKTADRRAEESILHQKRAHEKEMAEVRQVVKDGTMEEKKEKQARAARDEKDIRDNENTRRREVKALVENFETEIDRLKDKQGDSEDYYRHRSYEANRARDERYANLMRQKEQEIHEREQKLKNDLTFSEKEHKKILDHDRELATQRTVALLEKANDSKREALTKQTTASRQSMALQKANSNDQIKTLEKSLQAKTTSTSPADITPMQERALTRPIYESQQKQLATVEQTKKDAIESVRENYAARVTESVEDAQVDKANLTREHAAEISRERKEFTDTVQELTENQNRGEAEKNRAHERDVNKMQKMHARQMEKMQRRFNQLMEENRNESRSELSDTRQDAQFKERMKIREFEGKQTELARTYQRRMEDEKLALENEISKLREQLTQERQDAAKTRERDLENQRRGYEQRLAASEAQNHERERHIEASYQRQLDAARRAQNRLPASRKS